MQMTDIISSIVSSISPTALPIVVCVLGCCFIYLKIGKDRKQTSSATADSVSDILRVSVSLDRSAAAKTNKSSTVSRQISSSVSDCGGTF